MQNTGTIRESEESWSSLLLYAEYTVVDATQCWTLYDKGGALPFKMRRFFVTGQMNGLVTRQPRR